MGRVGEGRHALCCAATAPAVRLQSTHSRKLPVASSPPPYQHPSTPAQNIMFLCQFCVNPFWGNCWDRMILNRIPVIKHECQESVRVIQIELMGHNKGAAWKLKLDFLWLQYLSQAEKTVKQESWEWSVKLIQTMPCVLCHLSGRA